MIRDTTSDGKIILFQPHLETSCAERGVRPRVRGGRIAEVRGLGGITQAEDSADPPWRPAGSGRPVPPRLR